MVGENNGFDWPTEVQQRGEAILGDLRAGQEPLAYRRCLADCAVDPVAVSVAIYVRDGLSREIDGDENRGLN